MAGSSEREDQERKGLAAVSPSVRSIAPFGCAPMTDTDGSPSRNRIIVGMEAMPKRSASSRSSSMLTLTSLSAAGLLLDDAVEDRGDGVARATPLGPEVHEHRGLALDHFLLERVVLDCGCH